MESEEKDRLIWLANQLVMDIETDNMDEMVVDAQAIHDIVIGVI